MSMSQLVKRAITPGVTERPPVPGFSYVAFVVHPPRPGPVVLAIAHHDRKRAKLVLDATGESVGVDDCARLLKRYGISQVTGAPDEGEGDSLAHAICGALLLAERS